MISLKRVDLPAPFRPIRQIRSFFEIVVLTSENRGWGSEPNVRLRSESNGMELLGLVIYVNRD